MIDSQKSHFMANSYSMVYLQLVFAVKHRQALIPKAHKDELHKYITGIVQNRKHLMYAINSVPNHIHIFLALKPDQSISDLVKDIKTGSTHFINESKWCQHKFQWQEGFGCFSYSPSHIHNVIQYVMNQEEHITPKCLLKKSTWMY